MEAKRPLDLEMLPDSLFICMTFSLHGKPTSSSLAFHISPSQRQDFLRWGIFPIVNPRVSISSDFSYQTVRRSSVKPFPFACDTMSVTFLLLWHRENRFLLYSNLWALQPCWFFQTPYPFRFRLRVPFYRHNFTHPFILNRIYLKSIKWFFLFLWPRWPLQMEPIITSSRSGAGRESSPCAASSTASSLACYS